MRFWARVRAAVRSFVGRVTGDTVEPSEIERPDVSDFGGRTQSDDFPEASRLPDGWSIVGLYHRGSKTQRIHATDDTDVTDDDIENADAIIVWYEDAGEDGYRWIHGASGWRGVSDYIDRTIVIVSPPR